MFNISFKKLLILVILALAVFGWRGTIADFYVTHFGSEHSMSVFGRANHDTMDLGSWFSSFSLMSQQISSGGDASAKVQENALSGGKNISGQKLECEQAVAHKNQAMQALAEDRLEEYHIEMGLSNEALANCARQNGVVEDH